WISETGRWSISRPFAELGVLRCRSTLLWRRSEVIASYHGYSQTKVCEARWQPRKRITPDVTPRPSAPKTNGALSRSHCCRYWAEAERQFGLAGAVSWWRRRPPSHTSMPKW